MRIIGRKLIPLDDSTPYRITLKNGNFNALFGKEMEHLMFTNLDGMRNFFTSDFFSKRYPSAIMQHFYRGNWEEIE